MVVGGVADGGELDDVELISLDPVNHPVPDCLKQLGNFPTPIIWGGGAALQNGKLEKKTGK